MAAPKKPTNSRGVAAAKVKKTADAKKAGSQRAGMASTRGKAQAKREVGKQMAGKSKPKIVEQGAANVPASIMRLGKVAVDAYKKGQAAPIKGRPKPNSSTDPMRNKNAPRKTNREMFDEYYKNYGQRPDPR